MITPTSCIQCDAGNFGACICDCPYCDAKKLAFIVTGVNPTTTTPTLAYDPSPGVVGVQQSKEEKQAAGWKGAAAYGYDSDYD